MNLILEGYRWLSVVWVLWICIVCVICKRVMYDLRMECMCFFMKMQRGCGGNLAGGYGVAVGVSVNVCVGARVCFRRRGPLSAGGIISRVARRKKLTLTVARRVSSVLGGGLVVGG